MDTFKKWITGTFDWQHDSSKLMEERGRIYSKIRKEIILKRKKNPRYVDSDSISAKFEVGETVWLWVPQIGKKNLQRNEGPYVIESRTEPKTY